MLRAPGVVLSALVAIALAAPGLRGQTGIEGDLAVVFSYRPDPGEGELFEAGYRRHLEWHREHDDPLPWFAWYVVIGERRGLFVDGTFGVTARAFAERVDPAGDLADFVENVDPFATPASSSVYRLRPDLGTSRTLENREPTRVLRVFRVELEPGSGRHFEAWATAERERLLASASTPYVTWYEVVAGEAHPSWLLLLPMDGWEGLEAGPTPRFEDLEGGVRHVSSEVWLYRPDLSLLPDLPTEEEP